MMDLMVDTCVFLKMIEFNNFVREEGQEGLGDYIKLKIQLLKESEKDLSLKFGEEFHNDKRYRNLTFEEKLDKYKEYAKQKERDLLDAIETSQHLSNGETLDYKEKLKDENGENIVIKHFKKNEYISDAKKARAKADIEKFKAELEALTKFDDIKKEINAYKLLKDAIQDGIIYKGALEGKYRLFIPYIAYTEALNHTNPRPEDPDWITWAEEDINALAHDMFSHVAVQKGNKRAFGLIGTLAKAYRQKVEGIENETAMGEDKNSLGDWGDSKIAAVASLLGMTLVTNNGKDFIFDKSKGKDNFYIRNHLQAENAKNPFATDAMVISAEELITGLYSLPTKQRVLDVVEKESELEAFDSEIQFL